MSVISTPEPGQLVEVRQRPFVVLEVKKSGLPEDPMSAAGEQLQHLVSLSSVEDDALGEEMKVVWELEPGARVYEKMTLPEPQGFDDPARLDAFLDAVRWGAIASADVRSLQSPFRSGIEIEDYQLDPVVRALQMPRVNLLIADDVGLGKTIEAGLVVQELILRHRVRTTLVVCPASLQVQWRDQMRDKFGLEFRIVDTDLMKDLRRRRGIHVNPWRHFPRLITSIDFLKRERPLRLFREVLPAEGESAFPRKFDLMIVDEAHNVAPPGSGKYPIDSLRTTAIRTLAPHFEHKLFLSATPHNGYHESFSALLELLDDQRFARGVRPDRKQLASAMVRRLKSELPKKWDGTARFPERKIEAIEVSYTDEERHVHQMLKRYTKIRQDTARDGTEKFATGFVLKILKKRLFSSPAAFETTLVKHENSVRTAKRATSKRPAPSIKVLRRKVDEVEEEYADDQRYEDSTEEAIDTASKLFADLSEEEGKLLAELRDYARGAAARADSKAAALIDWLHEFIKPGGKWADTRVLIFTEYRTTQKWLQTLLAAEKLSGDGRLETLYGGMKSEDRENIKAAFQAGPKESPVRILLATDAASEGIDLQNHCHHLIHYEIPWNPSRMEQRNGRLDRYGQEASEVFVYHFVGEGYDSQAAVPAMSPGDLEGDLEFLMRAAQKVEVIREDLGNVGPVIADQVEEAMLGYRKTLNTDQAERDAQPLRTMLKFERDLRARIHLLHDQLQESKKALHLSAENIQRVVETGLNLAGQPALKEVRVSADGKTLDAFQVPPMSGSWAQCHEGLAHPHTEKVRPIVFDHGLIEKRDDVVLAHLNHRLVQMCLRLLRAEVWSSSDRKKLHRVTARLVPDTALDTVAVIAHGRIVILGGDNQRLHEELISAGGRLREGRFARIRNVGDVSAMLDAALEDPVPESMQRHLAELWPKHSEALLRSLESRMNDRTKGLQKALEERQTKEIADITTVLQELERGIRDELAGLAKPRQLLFEGWSNPERQQRERDINSIRARLETIPEEIKRETEGIRKRYENPTPRLFPVAITYLVPKKIATTFG